MNVVTSENEFLNLIEQGDVIILCFHNWSSHSIVAKKIVSDWTSNTKREVSLIDASNMNQDDYFIKWLSQKEQGDWSKEGIMTINKYKPQTRIHGYGEICWIRNKEVIGFEIIYGSFSSETLEERTQNLFIE